MTGFDQNGLVGLRRAAGAIDDCDVGYRKLGRRPRGGKRWHDKESHKQGEEYLSRRQRNAHLPGDRAFLESYHKRRWVAGVLAEWRLGWEGIGKRSSGWRRAGKMGHWKKEWKAHHGIAKSEEYSTQWQEVDRDY